MKNVLRSSLVAHWLVVPGDQASNPSGGEKFSFLVFESQSHDFFYLGLAKVLSLARTKIQNH